MANNVYGISNNMLNKDMHDFLDDDFNKINIEISNLMIKDKRGKSFKKKQSNKEYRENYKIKESERKIKKNEIDQDVPIQILKPAQLNLLNNINLAFLLKDLRKRDVIDATWLELKMIDEWVSNTTLDVNLYNFEINKSEDNKCIFGDSCIEWQRKYSHSDKRRKECDCSEVTCRNLHKYQALRKEMIHKTYVNSNGKTIQKIILKK